jgi:hypothetical protein
MCASALSGRRRGVLGRGRSVRSDRLVLWDRPSLPRSLVEVAGQTSGLFRCLAHIQIVLGTGGVEAT